jgi:hypothetical protein
MIAVKINSIVAVDWIHQLKQRFLPGGSIRPMNAVSSGRRRAYSLKKNSVKRRVA